MKMMKKLTAITLLGVIGLTTLLSGCGKKDDRTRLEKILEKGVIQVVTEPYFAPYEFIDPSLSGQAQYVGADMELARYIAAELGVELEIIPLEFSAALASIGEGKYDMIIAGLTYKPGREEAMELSIPYHLNEDHEGHGLLISLDRLTEFNSIDDFGGLKIAAQSGSLQENLISQQISDATYQPVINVMDAFLMVQEGKVDAAATSYRTGALYADANPSVVMSTVKFDTTSEGNILGVPKGETELIDAINEIIEKEKAAGLYKQWYEEGTEYAQRLGLD